MPNPIAFSNSTPKIGLPLLSPGQAQKEFFVNQALSVLDSLHPQAVVASQAVPPVEAADGTCFRVTAPAVDAWEGCEDHLALRIGGDWHFITPCVGMRLFDSAADQSLFFRSGWHASASPTMPVNGSVIDIEARAAIAQIVAALSTLGVIPEIAP